MAEQEKSYQPTKKESNPWVMYIIVKNSLGMSVGKIASQCGHAVGMLYEKYEKDLSDWDDSFSQYTSSKFSSKQLEQIKLRIDNFIAWKQTGHRKIVLKADDKEFEQIKKELESMAVVVRDAGLTEIGPEETVTALFPMQKASCPKIIKRLQCL